MFTLLDGIQIETKEARDIFKVAKDRPIVVNVRKCGQYEIRLDIVRFTEHVQAAVSLTTKKVSVLTMT